MAPRFHLPLRGDARRWNDVITAQKVAQCLSSRAFVYCAALTAPLGMTLIGGRIGVPAFVFEHLMVVLVVVMAIAGGRGPAIVAAVAGAVGDNVLLREPIGRPAITGLRDGIDLLLFATVGAIVGWLVDRLHQARTRALAAAERERTARDELDRIVATVTHDLATPLNAILGTIQFTRRLSSLSDVDVGRLLARVETAASRASSLLRTLADSKSLEQATLSLDRRLLDFRMVVEPVVRMLDRTSDRHPIALAMEATPLLVRGDSARLGRVVENLMTNAIKYSPHGGVVEVSVRREGEWVSLDVQDHGIGLPAEHAPTVRPRVSRARGRWRSSGNGSGALHHGRGDPAT